MKIEVRADNTVHIEGYVNAVERESRPVITPLGKVNELIEARAFGRAIGRADNIEMTVDHNPNAVVAQTRDGTLKLYEDSIGLRAEAVVSDDEIVRQARAGKVRGWSFGMRNAVGELEERAGKLPLRRIHDLDLEHVTLVINKMPCYSATSVELRAEAETDIEERAAEGDISLTVENPKIDYSAYENRIKQLEAAK